MACSTQMIYLAQLCSSTALVFSSVVVTPRLIPSAQRGHMQLLKDSI